MAGVARVESEGVYYDRDRDLPQVHFSAEYTLEGKVGEEMGIESRT